MTLCAEIHTAKRISRRDAARHLKAQRVSTWLTACYRRTHEPHAASVRPRKVVETLNRVGLRFVLVGTYSIGGYIEEPRATQDVDVLVRNRDFRKAVVSLHEAYPELKVNLDKAFAHFIDPATDKVALDVLRPHRKLLQVVFRNVHSLASYCHIPTLEMALACKFAMMISSDRRMDKRHIDAGDFISMVKRNRDRLDLEKLEKLGGVACKNGGRRIMRYFKDASADRTLRF